MFGSILEPIISSTIHYIRLCSQVDSADRFSIPADHTGDRGMELDQSMACAKAWEGVMKGVIL